MTSSICGPPYCATLALPVNDPRSKAVAAGDVDGDGDLDALMAQRCDVGAAPLLYTNDGTGIFSDASLQFPLAGERAEAVAWADVDGDGDLDAVLAQRACLLTPEPAQPALFLNDGAGNFTDVPGSFPVVAVYGASLELGDLDGDGAPDVWLGAQQRAYFNPFIGLDTTSGAQNHLFLNSGSGVFSEPAGALPSMQDAALDAVLADFDDDSDLDAWTATSGDDLLLLGDGQGNLGHADDVLPRFLHDTRTVAFGDFDGNGHLDAALGATGPDGTSLNELWLGDGTGAFERSATTTPTITRYAEDVAVGDVDGDGHLDLMLALSIDGNFETNKQDCRLWLGDGTGAFTDATLQLPQLPEDVGLARRVALADVDGDSDLDALVGYRTDWDGGGDIKLLRNDGAGNFASALFQVSLPIYDLEELRLGDLDGDGDDAYSLPYSEEVQRSQGRWESGR